MYEKITEVCREKLNKLGMQEYSSRLQMELLEISLQKEECAYLWKVYQKGIKAKKNEHNSLIPYLLGICDSIDLAKPPAFTDPEYPDIDIDYIPLVRQHLKEKFVIERYGADKVCNIVSYTAFGLKSLLIDMARIFGEDRGEILNITKPMVLRDGDREPLNLEKAKEMYPDLRKYLEDHPDIAEAVQVLLHADIPWDEFGYKHPPHRNRGMGQHASGLIIAGVPLEGFVPLVRGKEGLPAAAWGEGLASTDLSPVGLIKFDFLGLDSNEEIANCTKLILDRHGMDSICAVPGGPNWSDTSYLNDPEALEMANRGDLKGIFQFDSDGIQQVTRMIGVNRFDDLVALSSMYRPSVLDLGMHEEYCQRKKGEKEYELHPLIKPFMGKTYGVLIYQEDVLRILNIVGGIPLRDCDTVRKAISKKKIEKFAKYKVQFIEHGQKVLGESKEKVEEMWEQIEKFSGYGFSINHGTAYTYITSRQLYQKAHYTIEFYASALTNLKTGDDRIRMYIRDARKHQIPIEPVHLNKSKVNFEIIDNKIYYGFSKIKGIGEEMAQRIVTGQPYAGFEDFLKRFGTDAKTVQALIGLRVFDGDPVKLYKFYELYKNHHKKKLCQEKKVKADLLKHNLAFREFLGTQDEKYDLSNDDMVEFLLISCPEEKVKTLATLKKKYDNRVKTAKKNDVGEFQLTFDTFNAGDCEIDAELFDIYNDKTGERGEQTYLGFPWTHPVEKAGDITGQTFERLKSEEDSPGGIPIEILITEIQQKTSRNGNKYYSITGEDVDSAVGKITVFDSDWERFENELRVGSIVRLRLRPPQPPFSTFCLTSFPKWMQWKLPEKKNDLRVFVLKEGPPRPTKIGKALEKELLGISF